MEYLKDMVNYLQFQSACFAAGYWSIMGKLFDLRTHEKKVFQYRTFRAVFLRTYDGQEIDLIEEFDMQLSAFEFKYSEKNIKVPRAFVETYPCAKFLQVHKENYLQWLMNKTKS